jgi:hypothetical protein
LRRHVSPWSLSSFCFGFQRTFVSFCHSPKSPQEIEIFQTPKEERRAEQSKSKGERGGEVKGWGEEEGGEEEEGEEEREEEEGEEDRGGGGRGRDQ